MNNKRFVFIWRWCLLLNSNLSSKLYQFWYLYFHSIFKIREMWLLAGDICHLIHTPIDTLLKQVILITASDRW